MILALFSAAFFVLCIYAALIDIETLTIPNWLNGWLTFLFIPAAIVSAPGWDVAGLHLLVGAIAFIASVGLFFLGVYGGGDAKFIPAVMLWLGPAGAAPFLVVTALAGGILTIVIVILRGLDRKSTRLNSSHLVISYAVFCLKKKKEKKNNKKKKKKHKDHIRV